MEQVIWCSGAEFFPDALDLTEKEMKKTMLPATIDGWQHCSLKEAFKASMFLFKGAASVELLGIPLRFVAIKQYVMLLQAQQRTLPTNLFTNLAVTPCA